MRRSLILPLSSGRQGVNRHNDGAPDEAGRVHELEHGLDVVNITGDLQRREAFRSFAVGPVHRLPAGILTAKTCDQFDAGFVTLSHRVGVVADERLYLGCETPFDAVVVEHVTLGAPGVATDEEIVFEGAYWNGSAWAPLWTLDLTRGGSAGGSFQPLQRNGVVAWHRPSGWAATTVDSLSRFWVRLDFVRADDGEPALLDRQPTLVTPGFVAGHLGPVNGLGSFGRGLVVGGDAVAPRRSSGSGVKPPMAQGAAVGVVEGPGHGARQPVLVEKERDEGACFYDTQALPDWSGGTTWNPGVAGQFVKLVRSYTWQVEDPVPTTRAPAGQFLGSRLRTGLQPAASGNTVSQITVTGLGLPYAEFEGALLRCVARSGAGPALGEERQVVTSEGDVITSYPDWSAVPDTNNRFEVLRPHARVDLGGLSFMVDAMDVGGHQLTLKTAANFVADPSKAVTTPPSIGHFEVGPELRYAQIGADRWSTAIDPRRRRLLLANGGPVLVYDGILRRLAADYDSDVAKILLGRLNESRGVDEDDPLIPSLSWARAVPNARFVEALAGYVFLAGIPGDPQKLAWNIPGTDIWPLSFRTTVSDAENDPITGIRSLGDRLVIATATAIHEAELPSQAGELGTRAMVTATGFVSQASMQRVDLDGGVVLVGVTPGGLATYAPGGRWSRPLDRWDRLVEGGVNIGRLHQAVAAVWQARGWYIYAIPGPGSTSNNLIGVYDLRRQRHWLWRAPWGVSSMLAERSPAGVERIVFGTEDGFLQELVDAEQDDDHVAITGEARVPAVKMADRLLDFQRVYLELGDPGGSPMTLQTFIDGRTSHGGRTGTAAPYHQTKSASVTSGQARFDTGVYDTATYADDRKVSIDFPVRLGAQGTRFGLEVSGTCRWSLSAASVEASIAGQRRGMRRG